MEFQQTGQNTEQHVQLHQPTEKNLGDAVLRGEESRATPTRSAARQVR